MRFTFIALVVLLILLFGCIQQQPREKEVIKIGAILPLSGNSAFLGESELRGFELAIDEFNEQSAAFKAELIAEDSKGDPKEAVTAINKLIAVDDVRIVFASLSPISAAVAPITAEKGILTMLVSVLSPSIARESDFVFKFYPDITHFAEKIAGYLEKNNINKAALLVYNIEPGELFIQNFSNEYSGETVAIERFNKEDAEFRTQLTKIKARNPEALVFIGYPQNDLFLLNQMVEMDFTVPLIMQLANYDNVNEGAAEALKILKPVSTWYTFRKETNADFVNNFKNMFGIEPDSEAAYSYDAMKIMLQAIENCGQNPNCIKNELKTKEFETIVSRPTRFDPNGNSVLAVDLIKYSAEKTEWELLRE